MILTFKNKFKLRERIDCKTVPLLEQILMKDAEFKSWIEDIRSGKEKCKRIKTFITWKELKDIGKAIYEYYQTHYEDGKKRLNPYLEFGLLSIPALISSGEKEYQLIINLEED